MVKDHCKYLKTDLISISHKHLKTINGLRWRLE